MKELTVKIKSLLEEIKEQASKSKDYQNLELIEIYMRELCEQCENTLVVIEQRLDSLE